mmetsp:Transcript_13522/g.44051  ORF Transcript_13522/g.44051 Transcript_13522/m.44051 type:complete len:731 (+) Transcript_13522:27-2219(+)
MVSVVLVGCGFFGCGAHCPALRKLGARGEVVVRGVCSRSVESRRRALGRLGAGREYVCLEDVLRDAEVDVVLLALPRSAALDATVRAVAAGKGVWVEKPAAWSLGEAAALPRNGWRVLENWASKPGVRAFKDLLDRRVERATLLYHFSATTTTTKGARRGWRDALPAAERVVDVAVHFVRALRVWFGEVKEVLPPLSGGGGGGNVDDDDKKEEDLVVELRHFDGARGTLRLGASSEKAKCHVVVVAAQGGRRLEYDVSARTIYDGDEVVVVPNDPWIRGGVTETLRDAIRRGPGTSPEEALRDLSVVLRFLPFSNNGPSPPPAKADELASLVVAPRHDSDFSDHQRGGAFWLRYPPPPPVRRLLQKKYAVVGAGTSWGLAAALLAKKRNRRLETRLMDGVLRVTDSVAVVEAGVTVKALRLALAARSRTLESWPVYQDATVGGAVATASHGSSAQYGTLCDSVVALRLGDAWQRVDSQWECDAALLDSLDGVVTTTKRDNDDDDARCCVGKELVTAIAFRTRPSYRVVARHFVVVVENGSLEKEMDDLLRRAARFDHAWIHWFPDDAVSFLLTLEEQGGQDDDDKAPRDYDGRNFFPYPPALAAKLPRTSVETSYSAEYAVPLSKAAAVAAKIDDLGGAISAKGGDQQKSQKRFLEIKLLRAVPTAPKAAMNGPLASGGEDVVACFNLYVPTTPPLPWVDDVEGVLRAFHAAPHFGKGPGDSYRGPLTSS